jgi:hypothetical protein
VVLAVLTACGGDDAELVERVTTTAPIVTTESGLRCPRDLFESGTFDWAAGTPGASSPLDAAADRLGVEADDARLDVRSDGNQRVRVLFSPSERRTTAVLTVVDHGAGWLVETVDTCA